MSGFDAMQAAHMRGIVASPAHLGEMVTRKRAGIEDEDFAVVVIRHGREFDERGSRITYMRATVVVPAGLDVRDKDTLVFAMTKGGLLTDNRVETMVSRDGSGTTWEVVR